MIRCFISVCSVLCIAVLALAAPAAAAFPEKPIQAIVPWKPGGGSDMSIRIIAENMKKHMPQALITSNIDGASGMTGFVASHKAKPDGYTVLWDLPTNLTVTPVVTKAGFTWEDFEPVCIGVRGYTALVVPKNSPWKNAQEAFASTKANPSKTRWPVAVNATSHFNFFAINDAWGGGMKPVLIPAPGDKNRIISLLGGNGDITTVSYASAKPYIESGDLKVLAMVSDKRAPFAPDIPTLKEQGVNIAQDFLYSAFVPKGTPEAVRKQLEDAFAKALAEPETLQMLAAQSMEPYFRGKDDMRRIWGEEAKLYLRLAKENGLIKEQPKQ